MSISNLRLINFNKNHPDELKQRERYIVILVKIEAHSHGKAMLVAGTCKK